jgi:GntR family transcriptional regulator/MocR family aminotransferase
MRTSSPELLVELDRSRPRGLRAQLEQRLRDAIRAGRLRPGSRLPSSRALAADLQVTRGVVVAAYDQLAAEGYLATRQGRGTIVNAIATPAGAAQRPAPSNGARYDFRPGAPDVGLFPHAAWARATRAAMGRLPDAQLGYADPGGLPSLREALAGYLGRVRGVCCQPDQIVVCNGFSHGLSLVARALADSGCDEIAVEDPGHPVWRAQIHWAGARSRPIAVDGEGLRVADLARSSAGAVLTTPAHQYPTGVVLSAPRRLELAGWAAAGGRLVVEDDYDAEYRYDRQPVGALHGVAPDRVVYAGSLSKSLVPALRLGWLVVPSALRDAIIKARAVTDRFTTTITQATFAEFLERGELDRHLRRTRRIYRQRRDVLVAALRERLPGARATGVSAGLHVVVELPAGMDAAHVAAAAARHGILLHPLDHFRADPAPAGPSALVLGYSRLTPHQIQDGTRQLARIIGSVVR